MGNIQTYKLQMINSAGRGVDYQTQIVTTKLPNENIQNIPTTNDQFKGEG